MENKQYKKIKKARKLKKVREIWTLEEYKDITIWLKDVIDTNFEQINSTIDWTEGELRKLEEVKKRRSSERHYDRWREK